MTPRRQPDQRQHQLQYPPIRLPPSPISPTHSRGTPQQYEYLRPGWCGGSQLPTPPVTQSPHEPASSPPRKRQKLNPTTNCHISATIEEDVEQVPEQPLTDLLPYDSLPSIFIDEPSPSPDSCSYGLGQSHPDHLEYVPAWAEEYEDNALSSIFASDDPCDTIPSIGGADFNVTESPDDEVCFGMVSSAPSSAPSPAPVSLWLEGSLGLC